jgi:hypothetical protein
MALVVTVLVVGERLSPSETIEEILVRRESDLPRSAASGRDFAAAPGVAMNISRPPERRSRVSGCWIAIRGSWRSKVLPTLMATSSRVACRSLCRTPRAAFEFTEGIQP